jgi:hypothetical protein
MRGTHRLAKVAPVVAVAAVVIGGGGIAAGAALTSSHVRPHSGQSSHSLAGLVPADFGKVSAVNGSSASGTCGTAGSSGSFTVTSRRSTTPTTVDVSGTTKFVELGTPAPTFADVCVGDFAGAQGTSATTGTVTASNVFVVATLTHRHHPHGAFGNVSAVDGSSAPGTCGTATATGTFTVTDERGTRTTTVDVTGTTKFFDPGTPTATFADVCVGDFAGARGTTGTTGTVTASDVFLVGPQGFAFGFGHGLRMGIHRGFFDHFEV